MNRIHRLATAGADDATAVARRAARNELELTELVLPGTRPDDVLRAELEMVAVDELGRPCPVLPPQATEELAFAAPVSR